MAEPRLNFSAGNVINPYQPMVSSLGSMQSILTEAQNQKKKDEALLYGMGRDLVQDERAQQAALLAEKNYQENVAARIAQNALSAGTLENQILATANQKAYQDALVKNSQAELQLKKNQIAEERATNEALAKGLMVSNETVLPDTTKQVPTGKMILETNGVDINKQFANILPTNEESEKIRLGELLKGKTKKEQDAILTPIYLKSEQAKAAGVDKTGVQKAVEGAKDVVNALDPDTWLLKAGKAIGEWNRPEAEKLLESKKDESIKPQSYNQFKSTLLSDIDVANKKAEKVSDTVLKQYLKPETKEEVVKGKKKLMSQAEFQEGLTAAGITDPKARIKLGELLNTQIAKQQETENKIEEIKTKAVVDRLNEKYKMDLTLDNQMKLKDYDRQLSASKDLLSTLKDKAQIAKTMLDVEKAAGEMASVFGRSKEEIMKEYGF